MKSPGSAFHIKYNDIDMEIGGMHGFDQSIDYVIAMKAEGHAGRRCK
jgi:hypothetical protein